METRDVPDIVSTFREASGEMLAAVLDQSVDCIKVIGTDGALEYMNRNGQCAMEIDDFCIVAGKLWWELWPAETAPLVRSAFERGLAGESLRLEAAFCPTAKGTPRWWDVSVSPLRQSDGTIRGLASISRDVTEQVRTQDMRSAAADEMRHRLQNAYTLSGAIIMAAAKGSSDREAFAQEILERLHQLGIAQSILLDPARLSDPSLRTLVTQLTEPFAAGACKLEIARLPDVTLNERQTRALALAIGELSTNSNKYGALGDGGSVTIEGSLDEGRVVLRWFERSTRPVALIAREGGSGLRLINRAVAAEGGTFDVEWHDEGHDTVLTFPSRSP